MIQIDLGSGRCSLFILSNLSLKVDTDILARKKEGGGRGETRPQERLSLGRHTEELKFPDRGGGATKNVTG